MFCFLAALLLLLIIIFIMLSIILISTKEPRSQVLLILYIPITHNLLALFAPHILHKLLLWDALGNVYNSQ